MDESQVSACSFTEWYPAFSRHTFPSVMLLLPPGFAEFVTQDGVFLPDSSTAMPRRHSADPCSVEGVDYTSWSESETSSSSSTCDSGSLAAVHRGVDVSEFSDFQRQIDEAIARLGGKVLPKLNWSAPKDAWWMTSTQTMACTNSDEVLLLMQSSDRIAHDVCRAYESCSSSSSRQQGATGLIATNGSRPALTMVLRQWQTILPGREFRCFVHSSEVVGISQRDLTQRFDILPAAKSAIRVAILMLHHRHIAKRFPLDDYTYDVYVSAANVVQVVDFNPAGGVTALLLFESWSELGFDGLAATSSVHTPRSLPSTTTSSEAGDICNEESASQSAAAIAHLSCDGPSLTGTDGDASTSEALSGSRTSQRQGRRRHDDSTGHCHSSAGRGASNGSVCHQHEVTQVDFRIVTEAVVMRSAAGGYGVPFDFVDDGANAAVEDFARAYHRSQQ